MATRKECLNYILDELSLLDNITYRPMMGEYLLYHNGVLFGGIYDDRLLIKIVHNNKKYNLPEAIPYDRAKPMYMINDTIDRELLSEIVLDTCDGLINND